MDNMLAINGSFFDISFWQNFVSNALATFIGVYLSIRAGLYLLNKEYSVQREKELDIAINREVTFLLAILRVLGKNRDLLNLIKKPILEEPYELEELRLDLMLLENTHSIKYEYIHNLDLVINIDEAIYELQNVSRFHEQLYSVIYSDSKIQEIGNHSRGEFIEISRKLLISAITNAEEVVDSVIEKIRDHIKYENNNNSI